jgi:osmotically-inducible protein OsmY
MRSTVGIAGSWALALAMLFAPSAISVGSQNERPQRNDKKMHDNLVKEVRDHLLLLPYYSVFDNLLYKVDGDKVTLMGQVVRPTLKSDAENAVKEIEGVSTVDNEIQVLRLADGRPAAACDLSCDLRRRGAVPLWDVRVTFDSHHRE